MSTDRKLTSAVYAAVEKAYDHRCDIEDAADEILEIIEADRKRRGEPVQSDCHKECVIGDSNYAAGMLLGWNLCIDNNEEKFNRIRRDRLRAAAQASHASKAHDATPQPAEPDEERLAMEAVMKSVDPATWPGLTLAQRCALGRFAKPQPAEPVKVPSDGALDDALSNLEHDNYELSYSGYKNWQADIALIRAALARYGKGTP